MNDYDYRSFRILKRLKIVGIVKKALILKDRGLKKTIKKNIEPTNVENEEIKFNKSIKFKSGTIDIVVDHKINIDEILEKLKSLKIKYNLFYLTSTNATTKNYYKITESFFNYFFSSRAHIYICEEKKNTDQFFNCVMYINDENLIDNINKDLNKIENLKLLSNYNNKNNITVKTATFFDYKGTNYYSGGAERYLVDLYEVCKNLGYNLDIYQNAEKPFMRKFNNINVIGMATKNQPLNYSMDYIKEQVKIYNYATKYFSQLHIYSAFFECYPDCNKPSIGISHGVAWDGPANIKTNGIDFWQRNERIIESAIMCDKMISVDTNTANWFQTIDYQLGNQRVKVIPNYVNTNEFNIDENNKKKEKIIITYPRRLYEPRGMYLLLDIIDDLLEKYDNLEIHFVGKGFDNDIKNINEKIEKYPDKIFCYSQTPDKMHEVYKASDISLIPTLYSEGTSLSCLEAMASGNIVIATRIGGLTDLIINGYNGYLIEPNKKALLATIEDVIDNYNKQDIIRKRARESAEVFNKEKWAEAWKKELLGFNLKNKSENIDLVEFYIKDIRKINSKTIELIKTELSKNQLIYIRSQKIYKDDKISNGLLQMVPWDEEVVSEAKTIFVETDIKELVNRKEKIKLI